MKLGIMLDVDETFMTIWLSRSSKFRVKVRRWPQSPIGTILFLSLLRCPMMQKKNFVGGQTSWGVASCSPPSSLLESQLEQTLQNTSSFLYPPSERSELVNIMWCFDFLPSVCEQSINRLWHHCCTALVNWYNCFNRNIFDSCVKSWEYFRSANISLETSFSWLSGDIVRFKMDMGVVEKCTKMSTPFSMDFRTRQWRHITLSLSMTSLSLAGVYCARTLLAGAYVNV